jgi:meso-butanediol dehydrogenase / (S,S)-butanediol dehydrogenase / diacetyl reductase
VSETIDLSGRRAMVTGAGRGIGRAIALRLARAGADVAVNDVDRATAERTAAEITAIGRRTVALPGDISRSDEVHAACDGAVEALGGVDILVNNAGISLFRAIVDCTEEDWDRHLNIMAKATFLTMRRLAPAMMERGWGRIVNLGSYVAQLNTVTKFFGPYCAAKFAIVGLTQVAAQEFAPAVTVNAIGPGDVATEMMEAEWVQEGERHVRRGREGGIPSPPHPRQVRGPGRHRRWRPVPVLTTGRSSNGQPPHHERRPALQDRLRLPSQATRARRSSTSLRAMSAATPASRQ